MTKTILHITDMKKRRKAAWGIAQCAFVILMVGGAAIYHLLHGSSWYWPAAGLGLTALFCLMLWDNIRDFRKARTRYPTVEDMLAHWDREIEGPLG